MNPLSVLLPGFEGTELPEWVAARLADGMAGVCLFATNVGTPEQLRRLTDAIVAANPRAIIAIDEEGGDVTRLYQAVGSPFPGNAILGRLDDESLTAAVGKRVGEELAAVGVNVTFAPDADVNCNPLNPVIGVRSFGAEPGLVARHTAAWTRGLEATGVASCAKHFPGHGDTAQDSHLALPRVEADAATLDERELPPFAAAIKAGASTIMSSHLMVPALDPDNPATFSRPILRDLLRGHMGFDGVVVSDALDMAGASADRGIPAAAVSALDGGCDLLCIGTRNTDAQMGEIAAAIEAALLDGTLNENEFAQASDRVAALGERLAAARRPAGTVTPAPIADAAPARIGTAFAVSEKAATLLAGRSSVALVRVETTPSIAVGESPWGPWGIEGVEPFAIARDGDDLAALAAALPTGSLVVLVGRDNHLHGVMPALVDALGAEREVLTVDMGWPDPEKGLADIATFGASQLAGRALLNVLGW